MRLVALAVALLPVLAAAEDRLVRVVPLGEVEPELLEVASKQIAAHVDAKVEVVAREELPPNAFYAPRKRWRAERLLEFLETKSDGAWKVVGITNGEISTTKGEFPDWGIVGLGTLGGKACVISAHIYKRVTKARSVMLRRFGDSVAHELGHTLGMDHCETPGCVMADAKGNPLRSTDASTGEYCAKCRKLAPDGALKPPK